MTDTKQPKNWRRMLADLGGYENGLINIPAAGVIPIIDEVEKLRARLEELARQEPSYLLYPNGRCGLPGRPPLDAGHADATVLKLYLAAGARPVEPAPAAVVGPVTSTMVEAYLTTQRRIVEEADHPNAGGLHTNTVKAACRAGIEAALAVAPTTQPAPAAQDDAKDAARYRWLTDDHKRQATRIVRNAICERLPVMSLSAASANIDAAMAADIFGDAPQPSQEPLPLKPMCCRCLDESDDLLPANCSEKPELLTGAPLSMYHCPDCGAMVCAGFPHGPLCQTCHDRKHPDFDCDHTNTVKAACRAGIEAALAVAPTTQPAPAAQKGGA